MAENYYQEADGAAVVADSLDRLVVGTGKHRTHLESRLDEGRRLVVMDVIDRIKVHLLAFTLDVDHFATDKAVGAEQVRKHFDRLRIARLAHQFKSQNAKGIARHDGGGFAELLMARGLSAPKVIVVDAGQVIVNEGA